MNNQDQQQVNNKQLQQQLIKNQGDYNQQINEYRQRAAQQNVNQPQYNVPYSAPQMPNYNQQNIQYSQHQIPYGHYQSQNINYQAFIKYYFSIRNYHKYLVLFMWIYQIVSFILGVIIFATLESSCHGYIPYFMIYFIGTLLYLIKLSITLHKIINRKNDHISTKVMKSILAVFVIAAIIKLAFVIYTIVIYDVNIGDCYLKSGIQVLLAAVSIAEIIVMAIFMCYFYNNEKKIYRCQLKL